MVLALLALVWHGLVSRVASSVRDALARPLPANLLDPEAPGWAYRDDN